MAKAVLVLGWVMLTVGVGLIGTGLVGIAMTEGLQVALSMLNPFTNLLNYIAMMVTLAPGMLLINWGQRLRATATTSSEQ